jgi:hypothetical protein
VFLETNTCAMTQPLTGKAPSGVPQPRVHYEGPPRTDNSRSREPADPGDGVRILNPVRASDRVRYYHHDVQSRLEVLASWEGAVLAITKNAQPFTARLCDLDSDEISEAEFDISDVSRIDLDLLQIGGIFRWLIGYRKQSYGQQERISALVFRRLPAWSSIDIEQAVAEGKRLADRICVE